MSFSPPISVIGWDLWHNFTCSKEQCGCSAVGSASPCQGEGREFESRHPLSEDLPLKRWSGREARQRPAKPCTRVQIPSSPLAPRRAIGAVVARFPDTEEVTGSNPVSPTKPSGIS